MFRHRLNFGAKRRLIHERLPWSYFIKPGVVALKYEGFQRTARFRGPDIDSMSDTSVLMQMGRLNDALRRLRGQYSLHIEAQRVRVEEYPGDDLSEDERRAVWPDAVSWVLDEERREAFHSGEHYETIQYVTFVYKCRPAAQRRARHIMIKDAQPEPGLGYGDELADFMQQTEGVRSLLADLTQGCEWLDDAETLEYLHSTVSTSRHPITPSMGRYRIDHEVADCRVVGGNKPILGDCHLRTVTITNVPETMPAILDALNNRGFEYRWTTRWLPYDYGNGLEVIQGRRTDWGMFAMPFRHFIAQYLHMDAGQENATSDSMVDDAADALHAAKDDSLAIGKLQVNITVWHPSIKEVNRRVDEVIDVARKATLVAKRYNVAAVDCWLGTLPGHIYADLRQPIRTSVNLAHLIPWSSVWSGSRWNPYLNGPALAMTSSANTTPYRLNLHEGGEDGDLGHALILGPPGTGKTTLLNFLRTQYLRYPNAKVISIDSGRGAEVCTRLLGGVSYNVGVSGGIGFQPLARIDNQNWRAWAAEWVTELLRARNVVITAEVTAAVSRALADVARNDPEDRTLTELSVALPSDLKEAINFYCIDGDYGSLLDDNQERIAKSNVVTFEMAGLMQKKAVIGPVLEYLFHYLEHEVFQTNGKPDKDPVLLVVDEAWRFLGDTKFSAQFNEWLRLLRKLNVVVVFATQFVKDVITGPLAAALQESCPNTFLLANTKAADPTVRKGDTMSVRESYEALGLNNAEIDRIARMVRKKDYYHVSPAGKRMFRLGLGKVGLNVCGSGSPNALLRCDRLAQMPGDFAQNWFADVGLHHEADMIATYNAGIPDVPFALAAE